VTLEQSTQKELDKHMFKFNTSKEHALNIIRLIETIDLI